MKKRNLIVFLAVMGIILSLSACKKKNDIETYKGYIDETMKQVSKLSESLYIYDGEYLVYSMDKSTEIQDGNATVTSNVKELSSTSYQLESSSDVEFIENINRSKIVSLGITESNIKNYEIDGESIKLVIENSKIEAFFGGTFETADDIKVNMTFSNKLLTGYSFEYTLNSGRIAKVNMKVGE